MVRIVAHGVEERLAHVVRRTIEYHCKSPLLLDQVVDCRIVAFREDFVAVIMQRERKKLRDFRRVVNQQDPAQAFGYFFAGPVPGSRGFLAAAGSRSITHTRPPAV